MNFPVKSLSTVPSCTKSVTIGADGGDVIKLKQDRKVAVNSEEVVLEGSVWIRHTSSVFLADIFQFQLIFDLKYRLSLFFSGAPPTG